LTDFGTVAIGERRYKIMGIGFFRRLYRFLLCCPFLAEQDIFHYRPGK
jgi:hypothetical protein